MMAGHSLPWVSDPTAQALLNYTQITCPMLLLSLYILTFTVQTIVAARREGEVPQQTDQLGPGGKPLPKKKHNEPKKEADAVHGLDFSPPRKLLFEWLSVGVIASLLANIVVVILHALLARKEGWWCGQAPTVSSSGTLALASHANCPDLPGGLIHGLHFARYSHDRLDACADCSSLRNLECGSAHGDHHAGRVHCDLYIGASGANRGCPSEGRNKERHDRLGDYGSHD